jgi:hypothetical protein
MAIDVLLSLNFDVVLSFPFPPSKAKLIDVPKMCKTKTQQILFAAFLIFEKQVTSK